MIAPYTIVNDYTKIFYVAMQKSQVFCTQLDSHVVNLTNGENDVM